MKREMFLGALLGLTLCGHARTAAAANVSVRPGLVAGLNLADLTNDRGDADSGPLNKGVVAGAFLSFDLGRRFSLQPELLYSEKGNRSIFTDINESTVELRYIEVPVLARVHQLDRGTVRAFLSAGPYVGFRLSARLKVIIDDAVALDIADVDLDIEDNVRKTDVGFCVGGGVAFPLGARRFNLEGRYGQSLRTIVADPFPDDAKNRVISVMAGITF
jgi:hypothetical protein